jgi:hypothetical protein
MQTYFFYHRNNLAISNYKTDNTAEVRITGPKWCEIKTTVIRKTLNIMQKKKKTTYIHTKRQIISMIEALHWHSHSCRVSGFTHPVDVHGGLASHEF